MILGNIRGFLYSLLGILAGLSTLFVFSVLGLSACGLGPGIMVGGGVVFALDASYRSSTGSQLHPFRGGNLFFIPVWLIGIAAILSGFLIGAAVLTGNRVSRTGTYAPPAPEPYTPTTQITQTRLVPGRLWVCSNQAYIRTDPSETSNVIDTLYKSDGWYFDITATARANGNWVAISAHNALGWISIADLCSTPPVADQSPPATPTRQIYYAPTPIPTEAPIIANYNDVTLLQSGEFAYSGQHDEIAAVFDNGSIVTLALLGTFAYAPNQTKVRVKVKVTPQDLQDGYIRPQTKVRSIGQYNLRGEPQVIGTVLKEYPVLEMNLVDGFAIVTLEGWIINGALVR